MASSSSPAAAAPASVSRSAQAPAEMGGGPVAFALIAAFLVLMPFVRFTAVAGASDSQRITSVAVLAGVLLVMGSRQGARDVWDGVRLVGFWSRAALLAVVALGLASASRAPEPLYALVEVAGYAGLAGTGLLLAGAWRRDVRTAYANVEGLVLICAAGYAAFTFWYHVRSLMDGGTGWPYDARGVFGNARFMGQSQLVMIPFLVGALLRSAADGRGRWLRYGVRVVLALNVCLLVASRGRGAVLALAIALALGFVLMKGQRRRLAVEVAIAGTAGLLLHALLFPETALAGFSRSGEVSHGRWDLWATSLRMMADRPWLGVGPMHFAYYSGPKSAHPHNLPLQIASEWGVPAAAAFGLVALRALSRWGRFTRRAARDEGHVRRVVLSTALLAVLVNGMVDSALMVPASQLWIVIVVALMLAEAGRSRPAEALSSSGPSARWRAGLVLSGVCVVLPLVTVVVRDVPTLGRRFYDRQAWLDGHIKPRFWRVGSISPPEGPPPDLRARYWPAISEETWTGVIPARVADQD